MIIFAPAELACIGACWSLPPSCSVALATALPCQRKEFRNSTCLPKHLHNRKSADTTQVAPFPAAPSAEACRHVLQLVGVRQQNSRSRSPSSTRKTQSKQPEGPTMETYRFHEISALSDPRPYRHSALCGLQGWREAPCCARELRGRGWHRTRLGGIAAAATSCLSDYQVHIRGLRAWDFRMRC